MKKLTMFILKDCPHCRAALAINGELALEPRFADVEVEVVDEREQAELADSYDYYYVPCYYLGREKLHEGAATREDILAVFERAAKA